MKDINPAILFVMLMIPVLLVFWAKMPNSGRFIRVVKFWMVAPGAMILLLCLPVFAYQLYQAVGARSRLEALGLPDSRYFAHCENGLGGRPPRYAWCFSLRAVPADPVGDYLALAKNKGWMAERKTPSAAILSKNQVRVAVSFDRFGDEPRFTLQKMK